MESNQTNVTTELGFSIANKKPNSSEKPKQQHFKNVERS